MNVVVEGGIVLAYAVVGVALMLAGYLIVDALTPGKLHQQVWVEKSKNATLLVGSNLLGVSIIVCAAIFASADDFLTGLVSTLVYGLIGLVAMGLSFVLIDALTPGKLRDIVNEADLHPATWVSACAHFGISLIMSAALL